MGAAIFRRTGTVQIRVAAHYLEPARAEAGNRIVDRTDNGPIVGQNHIGNRT